MNIMYFEDFEVGQIFTTLGRTITEGDIVNFVGLTGFYSSLFMDEEFAKKTYMEGELLPDR